MAVEVIPALDGGSEADVEDAQSWDEVVLTLDLREIVLKEGEGFVRHVEKSIIALLQEEEKWIDGPDIEVVVLVALEEVKKVVEEVVGSRRGEEKRRTCRVVKS